MRMERELIELLKDQLQRKKIIELMVEGIHGPGISGK